MYVATCSYGNVVSRCLGAIFAVYSVVNDSDLKHNKHLVVTQLSWRKRTGHATLKQEAGSRTHSHTSPGNNNSLTYVLVVQHSSKKFSINKCPSFCFGWRPVAASCVFPSLQTTRELTHVNIGTSSLNSML